jgi:hypothetical protein
MIFGAAAAFAPPAQSQATSTESAQLPLWCAAGSAIARIGSAAGGEGQDLGGVVGAHRLVDGRLVIANAGSFELRFFDARGRLVRSVGRRGDGPGEFRQLTLLRSFSGDSLFTFDGRQLRASVFGPDGELSRSFRMPEAAGFVVIEDVFPDGGSIARVSQGFRSDETSTGRQRANVDLLTLDAVGGVVRDLGQFPGEESYALSSAGSMVVGPLVFGATLQAVALGDAVLVGISDESELRRFGRSGARTAISLPPLGFRRLPATDDDFRLAVDRYLEDFPPDARPIERRRFDDMPRLDSLPLFAGLRVDASGRAWVLRESHPDDVRRFWTVLDASGVPLARARTPDSGRVLEIGSGYVVVLLTDEVGVERVEVRPIDRGPTGPCAGGE